MIRYVLVAVFLFAMPASADSNLRVALEAVRDKDYDAARAAQRLVADPVGRDVVTWMLLRARQGTFAETLAFLDRRTDWPGLPFLRARQEGNIPPGTDPKTILNFFGTKAPRTAQGALRRAEAFATLGEPEAAQNTIVNAWVTLPMSDEDHLEYLTRYAGQLAPHHTARLDAMTWDGEVASAERMMGLVPEGVAAEVRARLALRLNQTGVDALIEAVPDQLRNSAGLSYERFRWRLDKGRIDGALEILFPMSVSASTLDRPAVWARHRESLARRLMREGRDADAYRVASPHHIPDSEATQLEWLSGYIALRKLGDAERGLRHFNIFAREVGTPISHGRAGYWLGRAHEALGNTEWARTNYAFAAGFQTSFYGQLAAERAGIPTDPRLTGSEQFPDWREASFMDSSVLRAALILRKAGEDWLAERFLTHLAESLTRTEQGQLIDLALHLNEHHIAVMIGKRAAQYGIELHAGYFAVPPELVNNRTNVPHELILSIARRESEFDPEVISHAGARGLMQVMPRTAEAMAERLGEPYDLSRLTTDPAYNARLGTGYLDFLEEEFGNSIILISAAYNAGPSRARRWVEALGHPADPGVDVVDWIEHVPFTETRNYIMRVTESIPVYRARLSGRSSPLGLNEMLKRR